MYLHMSVFAHAMLHRPRISARLGSGCSLFVFSILVPFFTEVAALPNLPLHAYAMVLAASSAASWCISGIPWLSSHPGYPLRQRCCMFVALR